MGNIERWREASDRAHASIRELTELGAVEWPMETERELAAEVECLRHQLQGAVSANERALAILNEAMGDVAGVDWPDDARTYIARAADALGGQ